MSEKRRIVIIGAGGQARELAWILRSIQAPVAYEPVGMIVSDVALLGPHDSAADVLGDTSWLVAHEHDVHCLALGIGMPGSRLKVAAEFEERFPRLAWPALVHPTAILGENVKLGYGALVSAGAILTVNVSLEPFAFVNFGATVGHEVTLGRGACVMPGANVSGGVTIGAGALIGTGAQVLQYRRVGARAQVGAGAVVTRDVPDDAVVVGVPARST